MTGPVAHLTSQESEWLALAERAVRGPWVVRPGRTYEPTVRIDPWDDGYPLELFQSGGLVEYQQATCEFIAAARTAVPELLKTIQALRGENEDLRRRLKLWEPQYSYTATLTISSGPVDRPQGQVMKLKIEKFIAGQGGIE